MECTYLLQVTIMRLQRTLINYYINAISLLHQQIEIMLTNKIKSLWLADSQNTLPFPSFDKIKTKRADYYK